MENTIYIYRGTTNKITIDENNKVVKTSMIYKYPVGSEIDAFILEKYFDFVEFLEDINLG